MLERNDDQQSSYHERDASFLREASVIDLRRPRSEQAPDLRMASTPAAQATRLPLHLLQRQPLFLRSQLGSCPRLVAGDARGGPANLSARLCFHRQDRSRGNGPHCSGTGCAMTRTSTTPSRFRLQLFRWTRHWVAGRMQSRSTSKPSPFSTSWTPTGSLRSSMAAVPTGRTLNRWTGGW